MIRRIGIGGMVVILSLFLWILPVLSHVTVVRFAATSMTAGTYMLGVGWSNVLRKYAPNIRMVCLAKGGTTKLLRGMVNGKWDIAFIGSPHLVCAKKGILLFKREKAYSKRKYYDPTRVLFAITTGWANYVVRADSGIHTVLDLKGKKVDLGMAGGFGGVMTKAVFKAEGLDIEKGDYKGIYVPVDQAMDQLRDNTGLSVALVWGGIPQPLITELSAKIPLRLLSLTKKGFRRYQKSFVVGPYTLLKIISPEEVKEAYKGRVINTSPVYTWTVPLMVVVRKDMSKKLVYTLVKVFWEHLNEVKSVSKQLKSVSIKTALKRLSAPLHPGALEYYKEVGALKYYENLTY